MSLDKLDISGALVYWTAVDCTWATLKAEATTLGLGHIVPPKRSPVATAIAALRVVWPNGRAYRIAHTRGMKGYEVYRIDRHGRRNTYTPVFRVLFTGGKDVNNPSVSVSAIFAIDLDDESLGARFTKAFREQGNLLGAWKVSRFMALAVQQLLGTPLRDRGGVYWIPATAIDRWAQVTTVVRDSIAAGDPGATQWAAHVMRIVHDEASVAAVVASVKAEILKDLDELDSSLKAGAATKTAHQAVDAANNLVARLELYKQLFGNTFQEFDKRTAAVKGAAAKAALRKAAAQKQRNPVAAGGAQ